MTDLDTTPVPGLRADLSLVSQLIPAGSRVLDLGCGRGELLRHLRENQACRGTGVEIDPDQVVAAIRAGVPVIELDIDLQLDEFADASYDVVVLSRTLQATRRPERVLTEIGRIGARCIVVMTNFAWWKHRLRLLRGRMPMSREMPYQWHDTPNIHNASMDEQIALFESLGFQVERRIALTERGTPLRYGLRAANLFSGANLYSLAAPPR